MAAGSAAGLSLIAGCTGGGGTEATTTEPPTETATTTATPTPTPESKVVDVAVGPEKRLRFDPESIEIRVGDTVRWTAESVGHNVTSKPGASEKCENPEGAEPFANYEGDQHFAIMDVGETYEHTFEVPGTYVYVCAPHAGQGMVGDITVVE
ncbi:plastocyanin/azurin family copper-binding protein [Haloferax sp. YSMS24]|uniref:plastocyanin/azurin family copper-binding protein n=1 Tax=unclassified Haloferax TaxID=2625095 RepID=UPI00398CB6AB